jgi:hypothetical protein
VLTAVRRKPFDRCNVEVGQRYQASGRGGPTCPRDDEDASQVKRMLVSPAAFGQAVERARALVQLRLRLRQHETINSLIVVFEKMAIAFSMSSASARCCASQLHRASLSQVADDWPTLGCSGTVDLSALTAPVNSRSAPTRRLGVVLGRLEIEGPCISRQTRSSGEPSATPV